MARTQTETLAPQRLAEALQSEPLVGVTAAARLLGIKPPNFRRDAAPHLIEIPVEGSASVYFRSQVEAFARERAERRAASNGHAE